MRRVICTDEPNSYGNEERDRRLIRQALNCIRLLRRRVFYFYCVPAINKFILGIVCLCIKKIISSLLKQETLLY